MEITTGVENLAHFDAAVPPVLRSPDQETATSPAPLRGGEESDRVPLPGSSEIAPELLQPEPTRELRSENLIQDPARETLRRYLERMNRFAESLNLGLRFGIYEDSEQLYVQLINRRTMSVVKTIPQEELLALRVKLEQLAGMLVDETA